MHLPFYHPSSRDEISSKERGKRISNPDPALRHVDPPKVAGGWVHEKTGQSVQSKYKTMRMLEFTYCGVNYN